jgi:hypothetical protein
VDGADQFVVREEPMKSVLWRDCQGETDRDRGGRRVQQLFQRAQRLLPRTHRRCRPCRPAHRQRRAAHRAARRNPSGSGTNPIAVGFPSADGSVIFDIGTASLMWGEVLLAAETGEALPPGVAFDATGTPP